MSLVPTGAQGSACALGSLPGLQDLLLGLSHLTLLSSPASRSLQTVCRGGAKLIDYIYTAEIEVTEENVQVNSAPADSSVYHILSPSPALPIYIIISDRKSTRLNSSHKHRSRMPSSA